MTEPLGGARSEPTYHSETAAVYGGLCRYWERCSPEKLDYFPGSSVSACEAYYGCLSDRDEASGSTLPPVPSFENPPACRDYIETAGCDSNLSRVTPNLWGTNLPSEGSVAAFPLTRIEACKDGDESALPGMGEPCFLDTPGCAGDLFCRAQQPFQIAGDNVCGICVPRLGVGDPCDNTVLCQAGTFCEMGVCTDGRLAGSRCEELGQCASGICLEELCRDLGNTGDVCALGHECLSGHCNKGICSASPKPDPLFAGDEGEPCQYGIECRLGLACVGGRFRAADCTASFGEPCIGAYPNSCEPGSVCSAPTSTCGPLRRAGESCTEDGACADGLVCRYADNTLKCVSPAPDGAACSVHADCSSAYCHRDIYAEACEPQSPWSTVCNLPPCDGCGVCAPRPAADTCFQ